MSLRTESILCTLRLLWDLLGKLRILVIVCGAALVFLAAFGVVHLFEPDPVEKRVEIPPVAASSPPAKPQPVEEATPQERVLEITDVKPRRRRLRDGSTQVAVTIGLAPLAQTKPGEVEIRVFFYDVTRAGELRPTDGQVAYAWLTPERDWSDPTPKFLEAMYLRPRRPRSSGERTRYGGFIVQVYSDGRLQDERGEPRQILAALKRQASSPVVAESKTSAGSDESEEEDLVGDDTEIPRKSARQITDAAVEQTPAPAATTADVPYGKPAPNKPGFVYSPHDERFIIDVRGVPPGTQIVDPNTGKPLRVP